MAMKILLCEKLQVAQALRLVLYISIFRESRKYFKLFLKTYYDELYSRGITTKTLSLQTITLLSLTEFSSICELIMDESMAEGIQ